MSAPAVILADDAGNLTLQIADGEGRVLDYRVEFVPPALDDFAVRLHGGGGPYRVAKSPGGRWRCQCADSKFRARKELRTCKHVREIRRLHLALRKAMPYVRTPQDEEEARCSGTPQGVR